MPPSLLLPRWGRWLTPWIFTNSCTGCWLDSQQASDYRLRDHTWDLPQNKRDGRQGRGKVSLPEGQTRLQALATCGGREAEKLFPTWTQSKAPAVPKQENGTVLRNPASSYLNNEPVGNLPLHWRWTAQGHHRALNQGWRAWGGRHG